MTRVCWLLAVCGTCLIGCGGTPPNITGKWVEKNPRTYAEAAAAHNEKRYVTGFTEVFPGSTIEFKSDGDLVISNVRSEVGVRFLGKYGHRFGQIQFSISSCEPVGQDGSRFDSISSSMEFAKKLGLLPPISQKYDFESDGTLTFIGHDGFRHSWVRVKE
ncbi:MAG: hypothetical protein ACKVQS_00870 [Fimbriimonadaceae bacterium]